MKTFTSLKATGIRPEEIVETTVDQSTTTPSRPKRATSHAKITSIPSREEVYSPPNSPIRSVHDGVDLNLLAAGESITDEQLEAAATVSLLRRHAKRMSVELLQMQQQMQHWQERQERTNSAIFNILERIEGRMQAQPQASAPAPTPSPNTSEAADGGDFPAALA